ncbi:unnamed protein product [Trichogramma brassicae]|uniref:Uncharacterized protein n=1 Tax=Trichogramma brassicae TaxID=86971 RepID=A0A6H5IV63_9HYME|nr:unnamed protein product [Trichogramma brassicae]
MARTGIVTYRVMHAGRVEACNKLYTSRAELPFVMCIELIFSQGPRPREHAERPPLLWQWQQQRRQHRHHTMKRKKSYAASNKQIIKRERESSMLISINDYLFLFNRRYMLK